MLQLLGILSGALAMVPPIPMPAFAFSFGPSRSSVPAIDDDRGPTAYAMERGIEPHFYATSVMQPAPAPSFRRLVKDLARSRKADRARELLEARVPPAAIEWLRDMIDTGDLWQIRMAAQPGFTEDEITASMLAAAQMWEAERQQAAGPQPETPGDDPDTTKGLQS
ncbi:hypothetical protein NOF55_16470 [Rhizobiaceae bacterium BDR2-2]|uniref:Uncharacterized protein n=1 Tax=Ectorhizobium quercum TaxID=2965071 RepID=A0AAE3MXS1_9HYPH|nr:hypothetical protein [Ectorhizobium quercum]MCX8996252.1 hypothetical protein [Ectorhizobium quercum]MCX8998709.1 hypothetical protein [Ectorhizobium quercum]